MKNMRRGFTLVELLVVIGIIGILTGLVLASYRKVRIDSFNARIRNDVRQLRILAEAAYDASAASYKDWTTKPSVSTSVQSLRSDIENAHNGSTTALQIRDQADKEFCISVPLHSSLGTFWCVDASGISQETTTACPVLEPFVCP